MRRGGFQTRPSNRGHDLDMTPLLSVKDLRFSYDSRPVLDAVTFDVAKGAMVGVIGPNGSGKSTLIKLLSKVLRPTKGVVLYRDHDIASMSPAELARHVAVVPQNPTVAFSFTGLETVVSGRYPHIGRFGFETERDIEIAHRAMALTDTIHLMDRHIDEMSGGEKQRAFLARAIAQEPELLLLDEPTTHLDINHQTEIMDLMRKLHKEENLTVLCVTHDLNIAAEYFDELLVLTDGRLAAAGSAPEVITENLIRAVYGADVVVGKNPRTGAPNVVLVPGVAPATAQRKGVKVHVICGGGTGSDLLRRLVIDGYPVSAGVLNAGDSDHQLAESLGVNVVEIPPFSPVSDIAHAHNVELARAANFVIVTTVPIGQGNIKNLEATLEAVSAGVPTIMFSSFETQDFCSGKATVLFKQLVEKGARTVTTLTEIFELVHKALM